MFHNKIIRKVTISAFRSIDKITIPLSEVNVFSGVNDSGKSNVLRALNLFFNGQSGFLKQLNFYQDYNKVSFARATMSAKMKQQIKIRVYFNAPDSYRSLKQEKEIFVEKSFDRTGHMVEKYSNDEKKSQINRLLNKIKYIYIPALKGEAVIQYLLGLIGEYQLINENSIEELNQEIVDNTVDLSEMLKKSNIPISTSFGLPTLLSDFWKRLAVETEIDCFSFLCDSIKSKSDPEKRLNPSQFKIPLTMRGEGIKSKYIPPLLQWLNKKNISNIYIWGIDEPENSLEFNLSSELADLYYNEYAQFAQILVTSHSLAFLNPDKDCKFAPNIFRCFKDENSTTSIKNFDDLFKNKDSLDLFNDIGVLEVQKEVMKQYRKLEKERESLTDTIKSQAKPLIITEGKTDKDIIKTAWCKLFPEEDIPFDIVPSGGGTEENDTVGNANEVKRTLTLISNISNRDLVIGLFDNDEEGNINFKGLDKRFFEGHSTEKFVRKHKTKNIYGLLLPCPTHRTLFVSESSIKQRYLVIEHFFKDSTLNKFRIKGENILGTDVFYIKGNKTKFSTEKISDLDNSDFEHFKTLFDQLNILINS